MLKRVGTGTSMLALLAKLVPALLLDWVDSASTTVTMSPTPMARLSRISELL
ncbi:hypothetical protein D3C80_2223260 [compost metagenome]